MPDPCSTGTNVPPYGPDSNREATSLRSALWIALPYYINHPHPHAPKNAQQPTTKSQPIIPITKITVQKPPTKSCPSLNPENPGSDNFLNLF